MSTERRQKYVDNLVKRTRFPCLVIHKTKHYNSHYLANDVNDLFKVSYHILKINVESSNYWEPKGYESLEAYVNEEEPYLSSSEKVNLNFLQQITELVNNESFDNENVFKKKAISDLNTLKKRFKEQNQEYDSYQKIMKAYNNKDGVLAYSMLTERSSYEYEGFVLESFENVDTKDVLTI
jgi:hypothetical protein